MDRESELSATCVTKSSLLQLLRERRTGNTTPKKKECQTVSQDVECPLPRLVREWIECCLKEGHIQPGQSQVGRLEGWPIRTYFKNSLYVDFLCWCALKGIPSYIVPSESTFYKSTDRIFDVVEEEKYRFPDLKVCRDRFSKYIKRRD